MQKVSEMNLLGLRKPLSLAQAEKIAAPKVPAPVLKRAPSGHTARATAAPATPTPRSTTLKRDEDGAVIVTQEQVARGLPPTGRFVVKDANGKTISTIEKGEGHCALGRKLRLHGGNNEAAVRHLAHERAIQESWFKGARC